MKKNRFFKQIFVSLGVISLGAVGITACGTSPRLSATRLVALGDYNVPAITPLKNTQIDYANPKFVTNYDDIYNSFAFLNQTKLAQEILTNTNAPIINLGDITATDASGGSNPSPISQNLFRFAAQNPQIVVPAIDGVLPLWTTNFAGENAIANPATPGPTYQFLNAIRNANKDYMFTFGGDQSLSLAAVAESKNYTAQDLANLYETIIQTLDLHVINFEIPVTNSNDQIEKLRMDAIQILKRTSGFENTHIYLTIPTELAGPQAQFFEMAKYALDNNLVDGVNLKVTKQIDVNVETNSSTVPGEEALYAMSAINAFAQSLKGDYTKIGATIDIGALNNAQQLSSSGQLWTLDDQALFLQFARAKNLNNVNVDILKDVPSFLQDNKAVVDPSNAHNFTLWNWNDVTAGIRQEDAFANGLATQNFAYTNLGNAYLQGQNLTLRFLPFQFFQNIVNFGTDMNPFSQDHKILPELLPFVDAPADFNLEKVGAIIAKWDGMVTSNDLRVVSNQGGAFPVTDRDRQTYFDTEITAWNSNN